MAKLIDRGWTVKRGIIAHRSKQRLMVVLILAILTQALSSKGTLRVRVGIDLALPAFIGPCGGPKSNEREAGHEGVYRLASHVFNGFTFRLHRTTGQELQLLHRQ